MDLIKCIHNSIPLTGKDSSSKMASGLEEQNLNHSQKDRTGGDGETHRNERPVRYEEPCLIFSDGPNLAPDMGGPLLGLSYKLVEALSFPKG